jgi:hypothetical protein
MTENANEHQNENELNTSLVRHINVEISAAS